MKKRISKLGEKIMKNVWKILGMAYVAVCGMLLFGANAKAYIDPSVATYAIQAIAGIVIAVGAAVGIYFRRAKKLISIIVISFLMVS